LGLPDAHFVRLLRPAPGHVDAVLLVRRLAGVAESAGQFGVAVRPVYFGVFTGGMGIASTKGGVLNGVVPSKSSVSCPPLAMSPPRSVRPAYAPAAPSTLFLSSLRLVSIALLLFVVTSS